jgi:DNA-binding NarL/FixJ family response regulator
MLTNLLLPWLSWLDLDEICDDGNRITFHLTSRQKAACPSCDQPSEELHSEYQRKIADLPCAGMAVRLQVQVRKFYCQDRDCPQIVFCERLSSLAAPYARRTERLRSEQRQVGFDLGGEAGTRAAQRQGMPVSADTLLRLVRRTPLSEQPTPCILGVDDWALRKGQVYGTILVDLEQHRPIDLLTDRSADTLAQWLEAHPGVEIISRDRASEYAEGARRGAPDAIQVADRFHLLQNGREMLQRLLARHQAALSAATATSDHMQPPPPLPIDSAPAEASNDDPSPQAAILVVDASPIEHESALKQLTKTEIDQELRRTRRHARYDNVRALHGTGMSWRAIARQLGMSIHTVRAYVVADQFPERATRPKVPSKLDPFLPYLRQQLEAGNDNAMQLWRSLRDEYNYSGSRPLVSRWVAKHRYLCPQPSPGEPKPKRRGKPPTALTSQPLPQARILSSLVVTASSLAVRAPSRRPQCERKPTH